MSFRNPVVLIVGWFLIMGLQESAAQNTSSSQPQSVQNKPHGLPLAPEFSVLKKVKSEETVTTESSQAKASTGPIADTAMAPRKLQIPADARRINRPAMGTGVGRAVQSTTDPNGPSVDARAIEDETSGDLLPPLVGAESILLKDDEARTFETGATKQKLLSSGKEVTEVIGAPLRNPGERSVLSKKTNADTNQNLNKAPASQSSDNTIPPSILADKTQAPATEAPATDTPANEMIAQPQLNIVNRNKIDETQTPQANQNDQALAPSGTNDQLAADQDNDLVTRKSIVPIISLEVVGPKEFVPERTVTFKMIVRNLGETPANDVTVNANLPENLKVISADKKLVSAGKKLRLSAGTIPPNGQRDFTLDVKSSERGTFDLETSISFSTDGKVKFDVVKPELAIEAQGPAQMKYGEPQEFRLRVTNTGDGSATNVHITSDLPRGFATISGETLNENIGNIPQGETRTIAVQLIAESVGEAKIEFSANADNDLQAVATESVTILRPAVSAEVQGPDLVYLDRDGVYAITVSNPSKLSVTDINVTLVIPDGLQVTSIDQEAAYNADERSLLWKLDRIDAGRSHTFQLKANATTEGRQIQKVLVTAAENVSNEVAHDTMVISRPDVNVVISDNSRPIKVGESTDFTVTLTNKGTKSAGEVKLEIELSDGLRALDSSKYTVDGTTVVFDTFDMDADQIVNLKFTVAGITAGDHVVRATITHDQSTRKLSAEESVFYYDPVQKRVASQSSQNR